MKKNWKGTWRRLRTPLIGAAVVISLLADSSPAHAMVHKTRNYVGQVVLGGGSAGKADCSTSYESYLNPPYSKAIQTPFTTAYASPNYSVASQRVASRAYYVYWDGSMWRTVWASNWTNVMTRTVYNTNGSYATTVFDVPGVTFPLGYGYPTTNYRGGSYYVGVYYQWIVNFQGIGERVVGERWTEFTASEYKVSTVTPGAPLARVISGAGTAYCMFP